MRVRMVSLEDGITSCGFRKMAAYVRRLNADTEAYYVTTNRYRGIRNALFGGLGSGGDLTDDEVDEVAQGLRGSDLVGFSSMTGYADLTRRIMHRVREIDPSIYMIWGGIHPIIHPEDAITADVDAICVGEGEFAFQEFLDAFKEGRDPTGVKNFWFKRDDEVIRNHFLPLMSPEEMEQLPFPLYRDGEKIFRRGEGLIDIELADYVRNDGLSYTTLWSIGCPFHCTYCGNTKFIANDHTYKRIRHPSARYIVEQIKDVRRRFPHLSQVSFHDDSFMAIPYPQLEEFAELWKQELDIPFAVYGVIPNYVKQEKFELLTWAGMNRIRMGIQSGSEHILDFYKRPSPPAKIRAAGEVIGRFTPKYHLPPAYDLIVDNPIETRQDVVDTLQLIYDMPRPVHAVHLLAQGDPQHRARATDQGARRRGRQDRLELLRDPAPSRQPAPVRAVPVEAAAVAVEAAAAPGPGEHRAAATLPADRRHAADAVPGPPRGRPLRAHGLLDLPRVDRVRVLARRPGRAMVATAHAAAAQARAAREVGRTLGRSAGRRARADGRGGAPARASRRGE